jgi:tetratricopeptide (TPR) repeat protein
MSQRHACPDGHRWEVEGEAAAPVCPICGQTASANDSAVATAGLTNESVPAGASARSAVGYEVLEELGRGGMGVVYRARHLKLDRVVALKVILSGAQASEEERSRFAAEAQAVARLRHPNVVTLLELGSADGAPYFTMDYCPGSLVEKVGKPWPARDAAALVEALARAVQHAHEHGVIHRDLKPANVLFTEDGTPRIADFGLAKKLDDARRTASGAILGTPAYMAPEQAAGKTSEIGPLVDVWALGAVLYELLVGRPPFLADGAANTLVRILSDDPSPPRSLDRSVPRDLETIALRCLSKEPRRRYASAKDLADDLRRFLDGEPIKARPRWGLSRRKRAWLKTGGVALLAALLVFGLFAGVGAYRHWSWRQYDQAWKRAARHRERQELDEAIAAYTEAHRLRPNEPDPLSNRGWVHFQKGEIDLALRDYEEALKRDPDNLWSFRGRGYVLLAAGRYEESIADLTRALEIDPNAGPPWLNRAKARLHLGRFAEAEADLGRAVAYPDTKDEAVHVRAVAHAAQGRYADCLRDVEELAGHLGVSQTLFSRSAIALALDERTTHRNTRDRLLALAEAAEEPTACVLAARLGALAEVTEVEPERLQRLVGRGLEVAPDSHFFRRVQAQVWLRAGKAEAALAELAAMLGRSSTYSPAIVRLLIALAHHKLRHKDDARRALAAALEEPVPVTHVHETLEYQVLLIEARKAIPSKD